jgi:hypothetical protein
MKLLILLIFIFTIFISCSGSPEKVEEQGCKDNRDCKTEENCNWTTKNCESAIVAPDWSYQSEKFDNIELPYLFVNKFIDYNTENNKHEGYEIRVSDLKTRKYIKTISFPFIPNSPILKNSYNKKFYFYNRLDDYDNDEKYGLMEIDPKTGIIKQVTATYANAKIGAIADNGKVYSITNKPCTHKDYPRVLGTEISIYNPKDNKETLICVPSILSYLHYNLNGKIYTEGDDEDVYIFEINPDDDSIREILSGMSAYGGWNIVSAMGNSIYFRIAYLQENKVSIDAIDISSRELSNIPFSLSTYTDGSTYYASSAGFEFNNNLFVFTYNRNKDYSYLIKYDTKNKKFTTLYSDISNGFKSFYDKDSNTIEIIPGLVFYLDDYSIEQFRGKDYKVKDPIKKF